MLSDFSPVRSLVFAAGLAVGATGASGQTDTPPYPAIDPYAVELAERAVAYLASQPEVYLNWFVSYDVVVDGREKITRTRSGENLLSREVGFYSYAEDQDRLREYIFDGGTFWIHNINDNAYAQVPFAGGFDDLVARVRVEFDIALPIWELLSKDGTDEILQNLEAAAYLGETRLAGRPAHHLAFAQYEHDWQVWISTDEANPVILSLVGTNPYAQGWPQYRAYFHDWDFAPEIAEDAFTFVPPPDAIRMVMPKVQSAAAAELEALAGGRAGSNQAGGSDAD